MIKIKKSRAIPTVVDVHRNCKLTQATTNNKNSYDLTPSDYNNGNKTFAFDSKIYGHPNIKKQLIDDQFGKCAFCEQNIVSVSYGDVEHFRPKGGYSQNDRDALHYASYYWLAYDWNNLVLACQICNQRYKKNLFPLLKVEKRALNHHDDIKKEKPFFVNPIEENPKFLIKFVGATATGIDRRHRGKKTIDALSLNRRGRRGISELFELRNDYYELVNNTYIISRALPGNGITQLQIDAAVEKMREFRSGKKQFSAVVRDNFPV